MGSGQNPSDAVMKKWRLTLISAGMMTIFFSNYTKWIVCHTTISDFV